jgi:hypothetical protein
MDRWSAWSNVQTTPGFAFGTESGSAGYDDTTAVLAGNWNADQMTQAVVYTVDQNSSIFEEIELCLRTTITANSITGYEINFRCTTMAPVRTDRALEWRFWKLYLRQHHERTWTAQR